MMEANSWMISLLMLLDDPEEGFAIERFFRFPDQVMSWRQALVRMVNRTNLGHDEWYIYDGWVDEWSGQ